MGYGQLNVKVGYTASYLNSGFNNNIFDSFNAQNSLETRFKNLHMLHGIQLGFRYKINIAAIEFTWENTTRSRNAIQVDSLEMFFEKNLYYSINSFSLGVQNNFGNFGYGASIDSRTIRVRTNIGATDQRTDILKQRGWTSRFYLSLNIPGGDFVSLSIQPYVQIPLESTDFYPLEMDLNPTSNANPDQFSEDLMTFGITLAFYNGAQN